MDFGPTPDHDAVREQVLRLCARFDDAYWLRRDTKGGFPADFHAAMAEAGWLGIAMPEAQGGAGLGITEAAVMMRAVGRNPAPA